MTSDGVRFEPDRPFVSPNAEAVIRVTLAGICATDLEITKGYMGYRGVMGHEFVGRVESAPDPAWIGKRVVADINAGCGSPHCDSCMRAHGHHCPARSVLGILGRDGAFAERLAIPLRNLVAVPDHVCDAAAVFAEPLAAAARILDQVVIAEGTSVLVLGAGRLGLLIARALATRSLRVSILVRNPARTRFVPPAVAIRRTDDAVERAFDVVVDATGSPDGLAAAVRHVRPEGVVVLKSTTHAAVPLSTAPWIIDEVTLVGSRCGNPATAVDLLATGAVDPRDLVTAELPLERGVEALTLATRPEHVKVLLRP